MPFSEENPHEVKHFGPVAIDVSNPVWNEQERTVILASENFAEAMRLGQTVSLRSNEKANFEEEGEVIEINKDTKTVKIRY